jgi:hypothetical protein
LKTGIHRASAGDSGQRSRFDLGSRLGGRNRLVVIAVIVVVVVIIIIAIAALSSGVRVS